MNGELAELLQDHMLVRKKVNLNVPVTVMICLLYTSDVYKRQQKKHIMKPFKQVLLAGMRAKTAMSLLLSIISVSYTHL